MKFLSKNGWVDTLIAIIIYLIIVYGIVALWGCKTEKNCWDNLQNNYSGYGSGYKAPKIVKKDNIYP